MREVGIFPDKLLFDRIMNFNEDMLNTEDGIFPDREEDGMLNTSNCERFPISSGIIPAFLTYKDIMKLFA